MQLEDLQNTFRSDEVRLYNENEDFIDDDKGVSGYLIRHYGECEVIDLNLGFDKNKPYIAIHIDYKEDSEDDDNRKPTYNDLSLDDSDYQADYDRMQWGAHDY